MRGEPLDRRFWNLVRVGDTDECWEWVGATSGHGYGVINRGEGRGKNILAHRLSWIIANGHIPKGLYVLHSCDNRPCVNPAHLWLGTAADNTRDMMLKRRNRSGRAKLTMEDVARIRHLAKSGLSVNEIARQFTQVRRVSVWRVVTGQTFRM